MIAVFQFSPKEQHNCVYPRRGQGKREREREDGEKRKKVSTIVAYSDLTKSKNGGGRLCVCVRIIWTRQV